MTSDTVAKLRKKSHKVVTIKDENDDETYEFEIQTLSTFDLVESEEMSKSLPEDGVVLNEEKMDKQKFQTLKEGIFPMMKKFIPLCTVKPKVTFIDGEENDNTLHAREVPMNVMSQLFNEILKLSGLDKDSAENLKKKQQAKSSNQQ